MSSSDSEYLNIPQDKFALKDAVPHTSWSWHFAGGYGKFLTTGEKLETHLGD